MQDRRLTGCFQAIAQVLLVLLMLFGLAELQVTQTQAAEDDDRVIEVRNPRTLPARIPCSRIALGKKGDYKPCIARLPDGELLIVAFDASHVKIGDGFREDMLLWRSTDEGHTWSDRTVIPLLGREPYFSVLKDGTLLITVHFLEQDVRNKDGYVCSLVL